MEVAIRSKKRRRSTSDDEDRLTKKKRKEEREEEASVATAMERLVSDEFPTELLWKIIGFSLRSGIGRCEISVHDDPATLSTRGLAWPKTLSQNALTTIRKAVAKILPESVILEMPAQFTQQTTSIGGPYYLVIPRALWGSEDRVRNLVLNLDLDVVLRLRNLVPRQPYPQWYHLTRATDGIERAGRRFPTLQTCVLVVFIGCFDRREEDASRPLPAFPRLDSTVGAKGTLDSLLIDLIEAFGKYGPGKRRLLRFECQERVVSRSMRRPPIWKNHIGPLVRVDALSDHFVDDEPSMVSDEDESRREVEILLYQAYRFTRQMVLHSRHNSLARSENAFDGLL